MRQAAPMAEPGSITTEQLWAAHEYFLRAVIPVAEEAGVRLGLHPDAPPPPGGGGGGSPCPPPPRGSARCAACRGSWAPLLPSAGCWRRCPATTAASPCA